MKSLAIQQGALPKDHPDIASTLYSMGVLHREFGNTGQRSFGEAESLLKQALEMRERVLRAGHPDIATSLSGLGVLYTWQKRLDKAEPLYKRALELREASLPPDHPDMAKSFNALTGLYSRKKAYQSAIELARRATAINIARTRQAQRSAKGARMDTARSELAQSLAPFHWLMRVAWPLGEDDPTQLPALREEAFVSAQWANLTSAGAALAQAIRGRSAVGETGLAPLVREQLALAELWQQLDKQLVALNLAPHEKRDPRALDLLVARHAQVQRRLAELDAQLAAEYPAYAALGNVEPVSIQEAQSVLRDDEALIQFALLRTDNPTDPAYAWLITRQTTRWLRLAETPARIQEHVRILRCGLDFSGEWDWSPTQQRWLAHAKECARLWPNGLGRYDPPPFQLSAAHELFRWLFGQINDDIKSKKLIIVPSGSLATLPFHVLVASEPAQSDNYANADWLSNSHSITVMPSVAGLRAFRLQTTRAPAPKSYAGFGNPLISGPSGADKRSWQKQACPPKIIELAQATRQARAVATGLLERGLANVDTLRLQPPLPETADEICAVAKDLGAAEDDVYLGERATESMIKKLNANGDLKTRRILHFATHGLLARDTGRISNALAEPAILLTPPSVATDHDDGLLTSSEIALLDLNADWVILSACNTAAGGAADDQGSEALSGLARAFFYAGTRALLVSHWAVDSYAAVKLTTRAVEEMKQRSDIGRAEALRRAIQALINDTSRPKHWTPANHPAIWAPFVLVGEDSP